MIKNKNLRSEIQEEIENLQILLRENKDNSSGVRLRGQISVLKWVLEKMDTPSKFDKYGCQRLAIVYVDKTKETEDYLKSMGYEKRSGDASNNRNLIAIVMGKKWFWECDRINKEISYDYF